MARAAGHAGRQAARLGLLIALTACAVIEDPPGGPPDFAAPFVASVRPDSGSIVPGFNEAARIEFNEVITEQARGGLEALVLFSPRPEALEVAWKRDAIEVKPKPGWIDGVVYRIVLLPGVADLRNNRMEEGVTVVFTTGGEIPTTRLSGTVLNWEEGQVGQGALVEAILLPDSLAYVTRADSVGEFELAQIPRGEYLVLATIDRNTNQKRDAREAFDSVSISLDSTASQILWAFAKDTTGPRLRDVVQADSQTIRLEFTQKLALAVPTSSSVTVWELPDTVPVPIDTVWNETAYESVRAAEQAARDSAAAAAAAADTTAPDTAAARPPAPPARPPQEPAEPTGSAAILLQRPALSSAWYIRMPGPMPPGRYLVGATAENLSGVLAESQRLFIVEAPPDST
ncbi:MAG: hypothetical protein JSW43_04780 [Gemmatimonadota bacterium]|nr:MAG: hypothetical protein JSW43_04780 [Gemmatimonadota bacterium]